MLETLTLMLIGALTGIMAGLFGIGGGLIVVPALAFWLPLKGIAPEQALHVAIATSLASITVTASASAWAHFPRRAVGVRALGWLVRHVGATQSLEDGGLSSWTAHDVQLRWQAPWQATVAVGVRNLFDRDPVVDPADPTGDGYALALYDGGGRTPYLQYHQRW